MKIFPASRLRSALTKRLAILILIPATVLFARTVHGRLYNLKTGEVSIVSFKSHMLDNPEFSVRFQNGIVITGEMIRGGGPEVIVGNSQANVNGHATTNGDGTISGPNGSSNVSVNADTNTSAAVTTHQSWVKNPLVRKGNMIGTGPNGLILRCAYTAQAGFIRGHGTGPCEDNQGGEYTLTF
jgi:hypothetical protein